MAVEHRGGRSPTIRRLGFWAVVGLVFLALGGGFELIRSSGAQPGPAVLAPDADAAPTPPTAAPSTPAAEVPVPPATAGEPTAVAGATAPAQPGVQPPCVDKPKPAGPSKLRIDKPREQKPVYEELLPIGILIAVIILVVARLPRAAIDHSPAFRRRRVLNWLPLGLTYAFLYMGRYNMTVLKDVGALSGADYGDINFWGALTYGVSFLINGPLTDRWGGRVTILIAAAGSLVTNAIIGVLIATGNTGDLKLTFSLLFSLNMYFQSFGAVSIVKVNAGWFHLRERGTFGGIFGILISLGIYFAFDWGFRIANATPNHLESLFFVPAAILALFFVLCLLFVRDNPSDAGLDDFDPGDASSGTVKGAERGWTVIKRLMTNRIIVIIAIIEFCSGFLRQAILQWYRDFAKGIGGMDSFVYANWGLVSCIAGITGGIFAGLISDHIFHSRRAPMSAVLYAIMLAGACFVLAVLSHPLVVSWTIAVMAMAIIGVHGMLSGTASADFGGRHNAGIAVGIIDGFVYLGNAFQSQVYGRTLPEKGSCASKDLDNWLAWPIWMIPMAVVGLGLGLVLWNARPDKGKPAAGGH
jgi:OPA family glycerol-3-phosphate transporter-like MFS transporter